jgi:hypothetical protein
VLTLHIQYLSITRPPSKPFILSLLKIAKKNAKFKLLFPGIMLFVGDNVTHCHHWCARPQFCGKIIDTEYDEDKDGPQEDPAVKTSGTEEELGKFGIEDSSDWNLWIKIAGEGHASPRAEEY